MAGRFRFLQGDVLQIINTAGYPKFSSDHMIHEYAKDIWDIIPVIMP